MRATISSKYLLTPLKIKYMRSGRTERVEASKEADVGLPTRDEIEEIERTTK
jgi:hypothetical protein